MDFRVLGSLEVRDDEGKLCAFRRRKERQLLAFLLLSPDQTASTGWLVEWLWDGRPPASAVANLQSYVSEVRRGLGSGGSRLKAQSGSYALVVEPGEHDVAVFEDLVSQGRRAAASSDHGLAVERFTKALGLWRSEVVAEGLPVPAELHIETARLEQLRTAIVEELFEARLALGQHRELVPELEAAVSKHPLQEGLWAQRMLALYRSGRQAEALNAYQEVRTLLAAELGVDPGPGLQDMQQRILAADPSLLATPDSSPRSQQPRPAQLPADLMSFTGRTDELARLLELAAHERQTVVITAIDGMAGIGKTALAVHAAHRLVSDFPDGQLFIDLHGFTEGLAPLEPAEALDRLLRSLGVPGEQIPYSVDERAALWRTQLAGRRMLVLLDNAATEAQIRPLLPGAATCLVLVTSRRRLAGLDDVRPVSLDVLPEADAIALFTGAAGPDRIGDQPIGLITEIVHLCGRLPLAIRIAAARLQARSTWSLSDLADRLRDQQRRIAVLEVGERSVAAAVELSYAALDDKQRRMFLLLGLHPGLDIEPYAAAALADVDLAEAEDLLEDLLDAHLLEQRQPGRFRFHDLVRAHARQACADHEPEDGRHAALDRLLTHYACSTSAAMDTFYPFDRGFRPVWPTAGEPSRAFRLEADARSWLEAELPNLLAAADHAAQAHAPEAVLHLSATLSRFLATSGHYDESRQLNLAAIDVARADGRRHGEMRALLGLGTVAYLQGRHAPAIEDYQLALTIAKEIGSRAGERSALEGLGSVQVIQGRHALAIESFEESLEIAREIGHRSGELNALNMLSISHTLQGRYEDSIGCLEQALSLARAIGDRVGEVTALGGLSGVYRSLEKPDLALASYEQALRIAGEIGHRPSMIFTLTGIGAIRRSQRDYEASAAAYQRAVEVARDIGYSPGVLDALTGFATLRYLEGLHGEAAGSFAEVLELAREVGHQNYEYEALLGLGFTTCATGRPADALDWHLQALDLAKQLGQPADQARAHHGLAEAGFQLGDVGHARRHWRQALDIFADLGVEGSEETDTAAIRERLAEIGQDA